MKKLLSTILFLTFLVGTVYSQNVPLIGSVAPSFKAASTNGDITFPDDSGKSWKVLFSHPQDYTPVCSSELLELAYRQAEFDKLGVKVAVISTDNVEMHKQWKASLEELNYKDRGSQKIEFPILDDHTHLASKLYGMIHPKVSSNKDIRGVFIIDPNNVIRSVNFYPMQVGRNLVEIERTILALQTADKESVCTPANWQKGDDVIVPHYPYTDKELSDNPKIADDYYNVGDRIWFKKKTSKY